MIVLVFLIVTSFSIMSIMPVANAVSVPSQVTITAPTCGLSIVSGSPINYGALKVGQLSEKQNVETTNTGNTAADVFLRGTHWTANDGADKVMDVGATHFQKMGSSYDGEPALSETEQFYNTNTPGGFMTSYQLRADLIAGQESFGGDAKQTVFITSRC